AGPVATGKINAVVVAHGLSPEVVKKESVSARLDASRTMHRFKPGGRRGKNTIANHKGRSIQRHILTRGVAERQVMQEHRAVRGVDRRVTIEFEMSVANPGFRRICSTVHV